MGGFIKSGCWSIWPWLRCQDAFFYAWTIRNWRIWEVQKIYWFMILQGVKVHFKILCTEAQQRQYIRCSIWKWIYCKRCIYWMCELMDTNRGKAAVGLHVAIKIPCLIFSCLIDRLPFFKLNYSRFCPCKVYVGRTWRWITMDAITGKAIRGKKRQLSAIKQFIRLLLQDGY